MRSTGGGMITDVIFDLGKVLTPFDRTIAYRRLEPHISSDMLDLLRTDTASFERGFHEDALALETGRIDFAEFHKRVDAVLETGLTLEEFRLIWCDIFWVNNDMAALGHVLAEQYRVWLASNTSRAHYEWIIERFPQIRFYRDAALSFELGVMKPETAYFERALEKFGVDPASAVFIDDIEDNVTAARSVGMQGIVFEGYARLVDELTRLGLNVPRKGLVER